MSLAMKYLKFSAAALAAGLLAGCAADEPFGLKGEGSVKLSTNISTKVQEVSRASSTEAELEESTIIWISNNKGPVRKFHGMAEVPDTPLKLVADSYVAEAWAGDSVPASFDDRYFYGYTPFTVRGGQTEQVTVTCKVANSVVAVSYSDDVDAVLSDYKLTVSHSQGSLTWEGRDDRRGYFMMNSRDKDLSWKLEGKKADGSSFTREGVIAGAQRATLYTLNVKCTPSSEVIGGGYLTIEVDESAVEIEDAIDIIAAPSITGFGFDISQPVRGEMGGLGRRSVWITANTSITSLILSGDVFSRLNIGGNDFDFFNMDAAYEPVIDAAGIHRTYKQNEDGTSSIKLTFEESFTSTLAEGDYPIDIRVVDANGKAAQAVLTFSVSDAPVVTADIDPASVWAHKAVIGGTLVKEGAAPVLKYRLQGASDWTDAAVTMNGSRFTAQLTGLQAGAVYEYAAATATFVSPLVKTFTTETEAQIPNGGFEDWSMDGKVQMLYGAGQSMFWDSGNHGSTTAPAFMGGGNITVPVESPRHGGTYAISMTTKSMIGIIAAGNAFVGKYLGTQGTNGVLGWGRPFASRPSKLRAWVKYTPATVTSAAAGAPDIVKGQPDKGIIYIALLDNSTAPKGPSADDKSKFSGAADFPVIVKTASPGQYFSRDDSNVIAYGEKVFDSATAGDGLVMVEIPIDYRRADVKSSYIVLTMSASKGGDYFAGGDGSCMIVDDLELIYE